MRDLEHDSIDIVGYLLGCDACGRKKNRVRLIYLAFVCMLVCIYVCMWKLPFEIWKGLTIQFQNGLTVQFRMIWKFNFEWSDDGAL